MNYLIENLGIKVYTEDWNGTERLPYYLSDRYKFKKANLEGVSCLFLMPKGELDNLASTKKHVAKVREVEPLPVVLQLSGITALRRKSLIDARIPFIAEGSQIYLPFLGVVLSERFYAATQPKEILMPSSQLLLFYFLYHDKTELYTCTTANLLNFSAMQISRSVKQLGALGLVSVRKDGVRTAISTTEARRALFNKARSHLLNPVRKRLYVECSLIPAGTPKSGLSALSELTMLNPTTMTTFAYYRKTGEFEWSDTLIDSDSQAEVEVWKYPPTLLPRQAGIVDTLSMIASILPTDNERIEQAINEALSMLWR